MKDEASPDKIDKVDLLVEVRTNETNEDQEVELLMPLKQKEMVVPQTDL